MNIYIFNTGNDIMKEEVPNYSQFWFGWTVNIVYFMDGNNIYVWA